jgi:hypothetical protein
VQCLGIFPECLVTITRSLVQLYENRRSRQRQILRLLLSLAQPSHETDRMQTSRLETKTRWGNSKEECKYRVSYALAYISDMAAVEA